MVKRLLLLLIFFTIIISARSQNIILNLGVNISGLNIKYYDLQYNTDNFPIIFPDLMLNYEHKLNNKFSLRPGVWFNRQGKRVVMDLGSGYYYEEKFSINYIDFPLLLTYHFNPKILSGYMLNLSAGPYLGYGYKGLVTSDNTAFVSEESLFLGEAEMHRTDFGYLLMAGVGYNDNQLALFVSGGLKNLAVTGGNYTMVKRICSGVNYIRIIDFTPNARRLYKKRFLR